MGDRWDLAAAVHRSPIHERTWVPKWRNDYADDAYDFDTNAGPLRLVKAFVEREMSQALGAKTQWRWTHSDEDTWQFEVRDHE